MSDKTAIVTGVPGWLGSRFLQCLEMGMPEVSSLAPPGKRRINVLVNEAASEEEVSQLRDRFDRSLNVVRGDLTCKDSLLPLFEESQNATLFHLAGVIHPDKGTRQFFEVNFAGTEHLLNLANSAGVKRFVYMSSNSPLGTNPSPDEQFDESSAYNPYMNYGKSKMLAEQAVLRAGSITTLETVIIRSPWFYGPGQPARQNLFFTMIKNGKVPLVGSGLNKRSMAYIDNICQGLLLAENIGSARGNIYWIADRQPYTMVEIIDTIEELLQSEFGMKVAHQRMHLPDQASSIAYCLDALLQSAGIYHQKIHVLSEMNKTIACSTAKAERELGYDPQISLKEGMRRSIRWVLENGGKI